MREAHSETVGARLIVVDDHAFMRAGIRAILSAQPGFKVVGEATDSEEAVACCRELRPDLVLMDVSMPKMDGITATRSIKAEFSETSVLVLTAHDDYNLLLDAVRAGAVGYVLKNSNPTHVIDAGRAVLDGETPLPRGSPCGCSGAWPRKPTRVGCADYPAASRILAEAAHAQGGGHEVL